MKFLRNKKLMHLGGYLLALTVIIFVVQYFILGGRIQALEESELKKEYTRIVQIENQKISIAVQDFINGKHDLASQIASQIEEQEHRLKILSEGGRVEQSEDFIKPLTRLPRITFTGLRENWEEYKSSIYRVLENGADQKGLSRELPAAGDSASAIAQPVTRVVSLVNQSATIQYEGLAINMGRWYDKLMLDLEEEVQQEKSSVTSWRVGLTIVNVLVGASFFGLFFMFVIQPLKTLRRNIVEHRHTNDFPGNEIGEIALSINNTIENLKDATEFVSAIGKGNLTISYKESFDRNYTQGNNKLADSLIEMQMKLREMNEEEQKRQWANEGLTRFVDILRSSNDNLHELGDKIISGLVQYTKSNQGALYILNDEDEANKYLELISLFAFDTKKHEQQRVKPGQGILGQTFLEKETTYLTDLPEEYIRITSGLGGAKPKCILVVPLKVDTDVYGLVELASFDEMQSHEIKFVEKLGETIASTLGNVRAAQKNKHLIEQFQQQTEEMRAQEEEMRQNMEELQATQEEVVRKERNYIQRIEELESALKENSGDHDLQKMAEEFAARELEYQKQLADLKRQLDEKPGKGEDWAIAESVEQTLKINLEAIRITQEELNRKRS
jgi:GAF domain-containing protein